MKRIVNFFRDLLNRLWNGLKLGMRAKLILIFLIVKVIPLVLLLAMACGQIMKLGDILKEIAVSDSAEALNDSAIENIERMTTDTAQKVADFLYSRDDDILFAAQLEPAEENYRSFVESKTGRLIKTGQWVLAPDGKSWVPAETEAYASTGTGGVSTNSENDDMDSFHYRQPEAFEYKNVPLYDEIAFIDLDGNEIEKYVTPNSTKVNYPMDYNLKNISHKENTFVKAETYFDKLKELEPGEIYVSDVIGAYVGSNYIGMYVPDTVAAAAADRRYAIEYDPEKQSYAGTENPNGQRFEGIVRWATPVTGSDDNIIGYVTFALNHDHIMELVDHITPMNERYTELPSANEGNYAFIWDYQCRSICHPRHNSITGFDPETGDPQIPWLESSIYDAWQKSGVEKWTDFIKDQPTFDEQSRSKKPATALTQAGLVGLDGRYLNNAPQCTGWMDLTADGGSGSFYILWSGIYKLTTAGAIPYYTGQYAPSEDNNYSRRGFGFVAIGAGLEDFAQPATEIGQRLSSAIGNHLTNAFTQLIVTTALIIALVVLIAIWLASFLTDTITNLINGISRFRSGERQFRFNAPVKDEFGTLADSFDEMADSIVDSVNSPLCITDMNRRIIYMNDYGLKLRKATLSEIVGRPYLENSLYPADSEYCPFKALDEGHEAEVWYDEDSDSYIRGTAHYLLDKSGKKIGYIILTMDLTDISRAWSKVEEQNILLDKVFSSSPDLIWYQDDQGRYMTVNPRFAAIVGKPEAEFIGKTASEVLPANVAHNFIKDDEKTIKSTAPLSTEENIIFANGHEETLETVRTPIYDSSGSLVGLLGFARNITARVAMEKELRSTQIELEQAVNVANKANEHKGEFLARMSHEIRTPMNAIIGMTNIAIKKLHEGEQRDPKIKEVKAHMHQIESSSQHLLGLLNDILDLSKIEAGKIELAEEATELMQLADTVVSIMRPRCSEKNIDFVTFFDSLPHSTFLVDSLRLRQVLINLLGNAVKFTPEAGKIEFHIRKLDRQDNKTLLQFLVRDTGIGISEEALSTIFKSFEQADNRISKQYGGTGLGLAISQLIVQLFGGEISVDSSLGDGSVFSFSIWLKETTSVLPKEEEIDIDVADKFTGKRVMLVDDVEINRIIVMSFLEATGMIIEEAADGVEAVNKFMESPENAFDIILMDVQMPNMDGYEASLAIRALNRKDAQNVPIVALTANAFKDDIDKALKSGMNDHIAKPVEMDRLLKVLLKFLS